MTRRRVLGMAWYHWLLIIILIFNAISRNPGESIGFILGTIVGGILFVRILVAIWSAGGEFRKGLQES